MPLHKPGVVPLAPSEGRFLGSRRNPIDAVSRRIERLENRVAALEAVVATRAAHVPIAPKPAFWAKHRGFGNYTVADRNGGEVRYMGGTNLNKVAATWLANALTTQPKDLSEEAFRTMLDQARRMTDTV